MEQLKFRIIEQIVDTKINSSGKKIYAYYSIIKCNDCGHEIKIYKNDHKRMNSCKICNIALYKKDFIGYENNQYKVLDFVEQKGKRLFYSVQCKSCNSIVTMRKDAILNDSRVSCIKCKGNGVKPSIKAPINIYKYYYLHGAKSRNLEWSLSDEQFENLIFGDCNYCNEKPKPIQHLKRYIKVKEVLNVNGIDRVNTHQGYNIENCVSCCSRCNRMKMALTKEEFLDQIVKIYNCFIKSSTTIPEGSTAQANGVGSGENPEKDYDIVCSIQ
jgi:ribosomal protein S27E